MAKREPLFEADLESNGGLLRLWSGEDVERFIAEEQSFWQIVHEGDMNQPFGVLNNRIGQLVQSLRQHVSNSDRDGGSTLLLNTYTDPNSKIPHSKSAAADGIMHIKETLGRDAARGALAATLPLGLWGEGIGGIRRPFWRGMMEQVVYENGLTSQAIEAAKRTLNGINGRAGQVFAGIENRANEQLQASAGDFESFLERQGGRAGELERQWLGRLNQFAAQAVDTTEKLETIHNTYLEQMKLKAPVEYWRNKAKEHRMAAMDLRNWLIGFFVLMIGGYVLAFWGLHQQLATFLLQFQGSTGALLVVSAVFALLASLPLWAGRLLVKFYLSEHHLATDAKEREIMTQTYLALTADGAVDEKDRTLILGALFRSTPDGVVKDNSQPDTSPAAMLSKLLDNR